MANATPRGQVAIICKLLPRKAMTAQELLTATDGTTPHNSYSLGILADRFGFKLVTHHGSEYEDGLMRYRFVAKATRKAKAKRNSNRKAA